MASKTYTQYRSDNAYHIALVLTSQSNVGGNYSDITYAYSVHSDSASAAYNYGYGNRVYLELNGTVILDTANIGRVQFTGAGQTHQFATGTIRAYHNADGSKSIPFRAIFQQTQALGNANYDLSGTFTLDTIPRTSQATINVTRATLGSTSVKVTTNRASTSFTHTIVYLIGNTEVKRQTGVGDSYTFTPPTSWASYFTNAKAAGVQVICYTYSGSTLIGQHPLIFTAEIPSSMKPTCSITVSEAAALPSGITGYIKGKSKLRVKVMASGIQGSSISAYTIKANGATYNAADITTDVLRTAGSNTITATVTDSRGVASDTASVKITVTDYSNPAISDLHAYRCSAEDDLTELDTGEFIAVTFDGVITALGDVNAKTCQVSYRSGDTSAWTAITVDLDTYSFNDKAVIFPADGDYIYEVKVDLTDSFSTSTYQSTVGSAYTFMNIHPSGRGVGFGTMADLEGWLKTAWNILSESLGNEDRGFQVRNALNTLSLLVGGSSGNAGLFDEDAGEWVFYKTPQGEVVLPKNTVVSGVLSVAKTLKPLGGGTMRPTNANRTQTGTGGIYSFKATSSMTSNKPKSDGHILGFEWDGTNGYDAQLALSNNNDPWMAIRAQNAGTWGSWKYLMLSDDIVISGNNYSGYIRFVRSKIQITWHYKSQNITINKAWGNIYESTSVINLGNYPAAFNATPRITLGLYANGRGSWIQSYASGSSTSAGTAYICSASSSSTANSMSVCVHAIGTYS